VSLDLLKLAGAELALEALGGTLILKPRSFFEVRGALGHPSRSSRAPSQSCACSLSVQAAREHPDLDCGLPGRAAAAFSAVMGLAFPGLWAPRDLRVQRTLGRWDLGSSAHQDASGKRTYVHVIYVVSGSYCLEWRAAPGQPWQVLWIPAGCALIAPHGLFADVEHRASSDGVRLIGYVTTPQSAGWLLAAGQRGRCSGCRCSLSRGSCRRAGGGCGGADHHGSAVLPHFQPPQGRRRRCRRAAADRGRAARAARPQKRGKVPVP
jgi:hypothetical protein